LSPLNVTHAALVSIDHVQSRSVEIERVPVPPGAGNVVGLLATVTPQRSAVGAEMDVSVLLHAAAISAIAAANAA
jgi:hypothetical protein